MSDFSTTTSFGDNKNTWRTATLVLGFALLISLAAHIGGASSAKADAHELTQPQFVQFNTQQPLSIGGFTTLNEQPAFVILDGQGQRIGALPMSVTPVSEE